MLFECLKVTKIAWQTNPYRLELSLSDQLEKLLIAGLQGHVDNVRGRFLGLHYKQFFVMIVNLQRFLL